MQKDNFNKILLNYLLVLFVVNNVFIGLAYYFSWEPWPALAIEVIVIGNLLIGYQTRAWHKKIGTGEYPQDSNNDVNNLPYDKGVGPAWNTDYAGEEYNPQWYTLKNLVGLAEIIFYTILFLLNQPFIIASWLVVKAISHGRASRSVGNAPAIKEGSAGAILRIGTILALGTALISAILLSLSGIKETHIFGLIVEFLK